MKFLQVIVLLFTALGCSSARIPVPEKNDFVLTNVSIVDVMQQRLVPQQSILVRDGVISEIFDDNSLKVPTSINRIDGAGGFVTPGLIDMHVHIYEPAAYTIALSHGVTHVRILNGIEQQLLWRDAVENDELIGASSTVSSPIVSGYEDALLHHTVHTAQEARDAVRQYKQQGYDLIKAYGNLSEEALLALVDEAKKLNIPVAKHGPHASGDQAVATLIGLQSFEHVEDIFQGPLNYQFDDKALPAVIDDLYQTQVAITPTLNIFYQLTKLSENKHDFLATVPQHYTSTIIAMETKRNQVERWLSASQNMAEHNRKTLNFLMTITGRLHQRKVPLLVGSDSGVLLSPHGLATHNEMALLHQSGLSAYEVLAAATINPAKALGLAHKTGQIKVGYNADFLFTSGDPTADLAVLENPESVVKKGRWFDSQQLRSLREQAIEERSTWSEFWALWQAL